MLIILRKIQAAPNWSGFFLTSKFNKMKIRFGSLVVGAIGKAGGQCIQRHRAQYILRNITVPTQTFQTHSNKQRVYMRYLAQTWSDLDDVDQGSWAFAATQISTFDKWGDPVVLSPRQAFTKLSMPGVRATGSIFSTAWPGSKVATIDFTWGNIDTPTQRINFTIGYRLNDYYLEFFAVRIRNWSVNPKPYKMKSILLLANSSPTDFGLYSALINAVGTLVEADYVALGFRFASVDGVWSPMQITKMVCE